MMRTIWLAGLIGCVPHIDRGPSVAEQIAQPTRLVELRESSPNIYLQAIIAAGSAYDPVGQEGLAHLTAQALAEAGAGEYDATAFQRALFPTGGEVEVVVDREWVSLRLACHVDQADRCAELFVAMLTAPRFELDVVERIRDRAVYAVGPGVLSNVEDLGNKALNGWLFEGDRTGHPVEGRLGVLPMLQAEHATQFWRRHYVRRAVVVGLGGDFDDAMRDRVAAQLEALPPVRGPELALSSPDPVSGRSLLVLDTTTPVTGFHLGHPLSVTRDHPDWPALFVGIQALGIHRHSAGRLYRSMRTQRGLNYGDYAYVEPFVQRGWSRYPEQGVVRTHPYFSIWIRPVSLENGPFSLKMALRELEMLVEEGLEEQEFEDIQQFLVASLPLEADNTGRRLAYALEAVAAGVPNPQDSLVAQIRDLTVEEVNVALRQYIRPDDLRIVAVSGEGEALRKKMIEGEPTPIVYADVTPDAATATVDAEVASSDVAIAPEHIFVTPAEGFFR